MCQIWKDRLARSAHDPSSNSQEQRLMVDPDKRDIAVVGAGFMGTVIATVYARHGYQVRITDASAKALDTFGERVKPIVSSLADERSDAGAILANIKTELSIAAAVQGCFFVHEVIHENLEAKQDLFARLDELCPPEVVLGTNTSSFRLSDIGKHVHHRERILGVHYITPAHIIDLVELIRADFTPDSLVAWGQEFLKTINHVGVVCAEVPGFLVNRLQYALLSEAYHIVESGIASREDVDKAMRTSLGPRLALWGPLLTEDLVVSKKTSAPIWDYLHEKTGDAKFRRPPAITRFVEAGQLGALTGKGWYSFGAEYPSIVLARDAQLKALLQWLRQNDHLEEFEAS
jgi:3-hydroxybutyryl-CoA dehydrogenase